VVKAELMAAWRRDNPKPEIVALLERVREMVVGELIVFTSWIRGN
jgi:hypothetical protein